MYENITYPELKALPDDQKVEALKVLKEEYVDFKTMAEKTGGATVALANLYARYVEGKKTGRQKGSKNKPKKTAIKALEAEIVPAQEDVVSAPEEKIEAVEVVVPDKQKRKPRQVNKTGKMQEIPEPSKLSSFHIELNKEMGGEEAQARIIGIANSILKDKKYELKMQVVEI